MQMLCRSSKANVYRHFYASGRAIVAHHGLARATFAHVHELANTESENSDGKGILEEWKGTCRGIQLMNVVGRARHSVRAVSKH